jgi:hypothetical protein
MTPSRLTRVLAISAAAMLLAATTSVTFAGGRPLSTTMAGANEVPPADPDGWGSVDITLNQGQGEVCVDITVANITLPATGAHIHFAPVGVNGGIVVPLPAPDASGTSSGCVAADPQLIKAIRQNPEAYYVNVHNVDYPGGAIRGQLGK